ncbi:TonB-linked SusC/RagA family outer membrane protein [Bacteroides zoogleoformans]|uniref:TonB-dependent receptor n=2 Tax=Bacteroides zoogleoformans TaxID=28119 RepID=A0ABN5IHK5_9BACE|nr:TonB-dependent receptor [Bacteroides zoogleoformans]TWJ10923.1 TonB-linked SusC/RagA family outer membrane protein [Bacteroides zoogleoformans]
MKDAKMLIKNWKKHQYLMLFLCLFFLSVGIPQVVYAASDVAMSVDQNRRITGVVKDVNGEPMIGVTVMVKGTATGAITDIDGNYNVSVSESKSVLTFSFVGYTSKEVTVDNQQVINVTLVEDSKMIDEVVVIGFQSQKKGNLTASVASVGAEILEDRPVANIGQALQGMVPGLNVSIAGGDPNKVPSLNIRGATTFRQRGTSNDDKNKFDVVSGSPLILLDGVEITAEDLNQLNPNDIDNMSFLKDASAAAIYGTRATFGVILVTTKGGVYKQKAKIDYSYNLAFDQPYKLPDIMDSYHIYKAGADRNLWTGAIVEYSQHDKDMMEHMMAYIKDPVSNKPYFMEGNAIQWVGNTNPYEELVKKWTPTQKHNLSISGGGDRISYYISLGMQDQKGMYEIRTDELKRYNAMLSVNAKVTDWFTVAAKASYNVFDYDAPTQQTDGVNLWQYAKSYYPENYIYQPVLTAPDDPLPNYVTENPVSYLYAGGRNITSRRKTILSINPEFTILPKILKIKADLSFTPTIYQQEKTHPKQSRVNNSWTALENRWATENTGYIQRSTTDRYAINVYADYNQTFVEKHNVSVLLGVNQEEEKYAGSSISLSKMLDPYILNPSLVEDITANTSGNSHHEIAQRALFGRVMYNYMSKYLIEVDARYDGSSKFPKDSRFQFFPTVSLGWRVSEEKFMDWSKEWLDNFKIRASWGRLGSQPSSVYPYQSVFGTTEGHFLFDGMRYPTGITTPSLTNPNLTWEKSTTKNLGFDFTFLRNRLTFTADIFKRKVTDILIPGGKDYPALIGDDNLPFENAGILKTTGFELQAKWSDKLANGFVYSLGVALSDDRAKVMSYPSNPTNKIGDGVLYKGYTVGDIWGYVTGGILQEDDFDGVGPNGKPLYYGPYFKGGQTYPGYVWYQDLDHDGVITTGLNTVDDPGDRKVIGNNSPRYRYNITANFQHKGFDLDLMFQGVGKRDYWLSSYSSYWGNGAGSWETYNNSWTPERTDAKFPMYGFGLGSYTQSGYLLDASYIKLKQMILGYTFPKAQVNKIGLQKLRLNVAAYNLFAISDMPKYYDTDYLSDAYPPKRTFSVGIQVGF